MESRKNIKYKIDKIINWVKRYPELTLYRMKNIDFVTSCYGKYLNEEEINTLYKEYNTMREYYSYIASKKTNRSLDKDNELLLKEANVGGIFGYSSFVEAVAEKHNISCVDAFYILRKYNSMETFYGRYRKNDIESTKDVLLAQKIFKPVYNIDQDTKYDKLVLDIVGESNGLNLYSSNKLVEVIDEVLDERQAKIVRYRYGLVDGDIRTLDDISEEMGISPSRIRSIEDRILEKLRVLSAKSRFISEYDMSKDLLPVDDKDLLDNAIMNVYITKANEDEVKVSNIVIRSLVLDNNGEFKTGVIERRITTGDFAKDSYISIKYLELDGTLSSWLERRNIKTLGDLLSNEYVKLLQTLSKENLKLLKKRLKAIGYTLRVEKDDFTLTGDIEKDYNYPTANLDMNPKIYYALTRRKIYSLGDLLNYEGDIRKIRNMGDKGYSELVKLLHKLGYRLRVEEPIKIESPSENKEVEVLKTENKELEQKIKEQEEKEKLLDQYIEEAMKNEELKKILLEKEAEIRRKEELLKSIGFKR